MKFPVLVKVAAAALAAAAINTPVQAHDDAAATTVRQRDPAHTHQLVRKWIEYGNTLDIEKLASIMSDDVVIYQPQNPKPLNKTEMIAFFKMLWKAYPDMHFESIGITAEGNEAASWERVTGTLKEAYTDPSTGKLVQPTGRKFDVYAAMRITYNDKDQISRVHIFWDRMEFMRQLGI